MWNPKEKVRAYLLRAKVSRILKLSSINRNVPEASARASGEGDENMVGFR